MKKILLPLLTIVLLSSCKNSLDKNTALGMLDKEYKEFCMAEVENNMIAHYSDMDLMRYCSSVNKLEKLGLVTVRENRYRNERIGYRINYTDLAKQEYDARMGMYSIKVGIYQLLPKEIVGISYEGDNNAVVLFKGDIKPTVFESIVKKHHKCREEYNIERKALFTYYEGSGWKFEKRLY